MDRRVAVRLDKLINGTTVFPELLDAEGRSVVDHADEAFRSQIYITLTLE